MNSKIMRLSGFCGVIAPIIAFVGITIAILNYPGFSWTQNALSDLGVASTISAPAFNYTLILTCLPAFVFAYCLFSLLRGSAIGKAGFFIFVLAIVALLCIGIFTENMEPMHYYASILFFVLFTLSMLIISAEFVLSKRGRLAALTFPLAIASAIVWAIQFSIGFGSSVAIPEAIAAAAFSIFTLYFGYKSLSGLIS